MASFGGSTYIMLNIAAGIIAVEMMVLNVLV